MLLTRFPKKSFFSSFIFFRRNMSRKVFCLFDVDGTLTPPRQAISNEMKECLSKLQNVVSIGIVGGSDFAKISEQMDYGDAVVKAFDYVFAENGLVAYKNGKQIGNKNIVDHMGEEKLQEFINYCLSYMSKLHLPLKRGTFVEFRTGMINISPIGRSCSRKERNDFEMFDKEHKIRESFVQALKEKFPDNGLTYSIGGQISFDCFPVGWDKTYCLRYLQDDGFSEIHFFGDKTFKGGNDYEIFSHKDVIGHTVTNPQDTQKQLTELFFS